MFTSTENQPANKRMEIRQNNMILQTKHIREKQRESYYTKSGFYSSSPQLSSNKTKKKK